MPHLPYLDDEFLLITRSMHKCTLPPDL
jgi:hypothetical protein